MTRIPIPTLPARWETGARGMEESAKHCGKSPTEQEIASRLRAGASVYRTCARELSESLGVPPPLTPFPPIELPTAS